MRGGSAGGLAVLRPREPRDQDGAGRGISALRPQNVMVGEGIDGLFGLAVRLFVEPGVTVATSLGAYPTFNFHVHGFGGRLVTTPYVNDREDPASLLDLARARGRRLIYFANPDNPMGSWWDAGAVQDMIAGLPRGRAPDAGRGLWRIRARGHAAAARRRRTRRCCASAPSPRPMAWRACGSATASAMPISSRAFDKIRNHFGVTRMGQIAGIAALADQDHLRAVVAKVQAAREEIARIARANGLTPLPSATNFVTIDCGRDGDLCKARARSSGRRRRLRANAGCRPPEPLHPRHRGHGGRPGDTGRGIAEGAEGCGLTRDCRKKRKWPGPRNPAMMQ